MHRSRSVPANAGCAELGAYRKTSKDSQTTRIGSDELAPIPFLLKARNARVLELCCRLNKSLACSPSPVLTHDLRSSADLDSPLRNSCRLLQHYRSGVEGHMQAWEQGKLAAGGTVPLPFASRLSCVVRAARRNLVLSISRC